MRVASIQCPVARRKRQRGTAAVELLITVPFIITGVLGLLFLFNVHFARQRSFAALPEISRQAAEEGRYRSGWRPHEEAQCSIDQYRVERVTSLSSAELQACWEAGYAPDEELTRVSFRSTTAIQGMPGTSRPVTVGTWYAQTYLKK